MRKAMLLAAVLTVGFSVTLVSGAGADFSGKWILSEVNPSFVAEIPNVLLVIEQTGNVFKVIRVTVDEDKTVESQYTLDGAENINTEPNVAGQATIRSTSTWNNSVLVLEGSSTFTGPDKDVTTTWKTEYLLSEIGEVLTVAKTRQTPFGEVVITEVFTRKQLVYDIERSPSQFDEMCISET